MQAVSYRDYQSKEALDEAFGVGGWWYIGPQRFSGPKSLRQSWLATPFVPGEDGTPVEVFRRYAEWLDKRMGWTADGRLTDQRAELGIIAADPRIKAVVTWLDVEPNHGKLVAMHVKHIRENSTFIDLRTMEVADIYETCKRVESAGTVSGERAREKVQYGLLGG